MTDFDNTPVIKPAAAIRGAHAPERKGRQVLKTLVEQGEVTLHGGYLTPNDFKKFARALQDSVAA